MKKFFSFICSLLVSCLLFSSCTPPTGASENISSTSLDGSSTISSIIESSENEESSTSIDEDNEDTPSEEIEIDFSDKHYVAFGDSITAGSNLPSRIYAYPNVVAKTLDMTVKNQAVGGATLGYDTTDDKRRCISNDIVEFISNTSNYDIISVTGGSNDKGRQIPLGSIIDNTNLSVYGSLNIIASTLTQKCPTAFIFFITPIKNPTCEVPNKLGYTLKDICIAIEEVAHKYSIPVLDLYNTSNYEKVDCGMYAEGSDGWHPLKEFVSDYMAPQVAQFIKDNYKEKRAS